MKEAFTVCQTLAVVILRDLPLLICIIQKWEIIREIRFLFPFLQKLCIYVLDIIQKSKAASAHLNLLTVTVNDLIGDIKQPEIALHPLPVFFCILPKPQLHSPRSDLCPSIPVKQMPHHSIKHTLPLLISRKRILIPFENQCCLHTSIQSARLHPQFNMRF